MSPTGQEKRSVTVDPWPCHRLPKREWCDRKGAGGFMGHTCVPADRAPTFTKDEMAEISRRVDEQRGYDIDSHKRVMAEIDADERKAREALRAAQIRRAIVLRLHAHLIAESKS